MGLGYRTNLWDRSMGLIYGAHRDALKGGVERSVDLGGDLWGWAMGLGYRTDLWGRSMGLGWAMGLIYGAVLGSGAH